MRGEPRAVGLGMACWLCWSRQPSWCMSYDDGGGAVYTRWFCHTCYSLMFPALPEIPAFEGKQPNVVRLDAAALIAEAEERLRTEEPSHAH